MDRRKQSVTDMMVLSEWTAEQILEMNNKNAKHPMTYKRQEYVAGHDSVRLEKIRYIKEDKFKMI